MTPQVHFNEIAYGKMKALVDNCSKEIAWHGTIEQASPTTFIVTDILVYPQSATAATVESHDEYYPQWLDSLDDDTFNSIRLQGHSHVNMGITPSTVDTDFYETIIQHITDYYIFIIMNKHGKIWANIYDVKNNQVYEQQDVVVTHDGEQFNKWYEEQYALHMHASTYKYDYTSATAEQRYLQVLGNAYTLDDVTKVSRRSGKYAK